MYEWAGERERGESQCYHHLQSYYDPLSLSFHQPTPLFLHYTCTHHRHRLCTHAPPAPLTLWVEEVEYPNTNAIPRVSQPVRGVTGENHCLAPTHSSGQGVRQGAQGGAVWFPWVLEVKGGGGVGYKWLTSTSSQTGQHFCGQDGGALQSSGSAAAPLPLPLLVCYCLLLLPFIGFIFIYLFVTRSLYTF